MEKEVVKPRLKSNEKHCPRCGEVMVVNEEEDCTECHYCGYIDCGDDDE